MQDQSKDAWQTLYKLEYQERELDHGDVPGHHYVEPHWILTDHYGNICGQYRDGAYAVKQARRKYKKLIRRMEKSITS